jgi:hypothetical protein
MQGRTITDSESFVTARIAIFFSFLSLFAIPDAWRNWRNTFVCLPRLISFIQVQARTATPLTCNTYASISAVILFCLADSSNFLYYLTSFACHGTLS